MNKKQLFERVLNIAGETQRPYGTIAQKNVKYIAAQSDVNPPTPLGQFLKKKAISIPDTHNSPGSRPLESYEAYGRWWWDGNRIKVNGGPSGSGQGHPHCEIAGYWGVESFNEAGRPTGVVLIRGRMLADEEAKFIEEHKEEILTAIQGLFPKIR